MPTKYLPQCTIKIDGADAPAEFMNDLYEVVVESSLYLPDMFAIQVLDPDLKWVDDGRFDAGKAVSIAITRESDQGARSGTLIDGEITAIEPHFRAEGETRLMIRGYTKAHRLHRGKQTRTFLQQTDSQIVQSVASEAGLQADTDSTTVTYDYVLQNNQTNMEFLQARAERLGFQVGVGGSKLYFKKGDTSFGSGPTLEFGVNLMRFQPCLDLTHQASKVKVKGWDAKGKQAISAEASPSSGLNQGGMTQTGGAKAASAFGGAAEAVITDLPVTTQADATALATGLSNDIGREAMRAEGTCLGDPAIKAGWTVTISRVGTRFNGNYRVTTAQHVYSRDGYETIFTVSGRRPITIGSILERREAVDSGLMRGVVTGLVTNLNDPDNLGRVKVKFAWLGEIESDWVRMAAPMAGATRGFYMLPEVNDEVLLAFEHGDAARPYILGVLWNNTDKPPEGNDVATSGGKVNKRTIKSRSGHLIVLDDTSGSEKITIQDKTGKNKIIFESASNKVSIDAGQDIAITAGGPVTLKATGKMDITSDQDVTIQGNNVNIKGKMGAKLEGGMQLGLKGGAGGATLEGGTGAKVALSGPSVNLNNGALEVM